MLPYGDDVMTKLTCRFLAQGLLLFASTGLSSSAGSGILHGIVVDGSGAPVTNLTAVVKHLEGQFPFSGSQALTGSGEFVLNPTVGSFLVELVDESGEVVDYRTGINIFNNITTFLLFTVDQPTLCQTNLGFGTSGGMTLTACGDDLTTAGSSATLNVYNATGSSVVFAPVGLINAPTPLEGGVLVPFPWVTIVPLGTDIFGRVQLSIPGSASPPVSVFIQVVDTNGPSYRFSNAIEVDIGL